MPDNILLSGPAGAGKSQELARLLREYPGLAVSADFQSLYVALTQSVRDANGRYPLRNPDLLPLTEYIKRVMITQARERGIGIIATNASGDLVRRAMLMGEMGVSVERVIDLGEQAFPNRLLGIATLDRLRYLAYRIVLDGDSYRAPRPFPDDALQSTHHREEPNTKTPII